MDTNLLYNSNTGDIYRNVTTSNKCKVGDLAGSIRADGYRGMSYFGREYLCHRVAWRLYYGKWPAKELDHINGNKLDNRIDNLREVTRGQNMQNILTPNKSNKLGVKGVYQNKLKFVACIKYNNNVHYLGSFSTVEEASAAYQAAKSMYHIKSNENSI